MMKKSNIESFKKFECSEDNLSLILGGRTTSGLIPIGGTSADRHLINPFKKFLSYCLGLNIKTYTF